MSLPVQFYTLLAMIGMGSFFGAALDTYQRFLKRKSRKVWIVFINDILFWILHGLIMFYILFQVNYGEVRFYLVLALLCGFAAYQALFKTSYMKMLEWGIRFVTASARFVRRLFQILVYNPIKGLILLLVSMFLFIGKALLGLVTITGKVLLWVLKIMIKPFLILAKLLWYLVPKPVKKSVGQLWSHLAGVLKAGKNISIKGYHAIRSLFNRKR